MTIFSDFTMAELRERGLRFTVSSDTFERQYYPTHRNTLEAFSAAPTSEARQVKEQVYQLWHTHDATTLPPTKLPKPQWVATVSIPIEPAIPELYVEVGSARQPHRVTLPLMMAGRPRDIRELQAEIEQLVESQQISRTQSAAFYLGLAAVGRQANPQAANGNIVTSENNMALRVSDLEWAGLSALSGLKPTCIERPGHVVEAAKPTRRVVQQQQQTIQRL